MRVLVTGARGFIGKNLIVHLEEDDQFSVLSYSRENSLDGLVGLVDQADAIIHLAGENRPEDVSAFEKVNAGLTQSLCDAVRTTGRQIPMVLASSTQARLDNPYGQSKRSAEEIVESLANETGNPVYVYRLPGVLVSGASPTTIQWLRLFATILHRISLFI